MKVTSILIFILNIILIGTTAEAETKSTLDKQQEALTVIADFAERICRDVPLDNKNTSLELSGDVNVELKGLLKKFTDLGIKGAAKYTNSEYSGVLQKDLAVVLKESSDCKLNIINELSDKLIPVSTTSPSLRFSESDFRREANPRFGFSFVYPKTWDRSDPDNGDGNRYVNPIDTDVKCSFWGGYAVVSPTLEKWVDWTLSINASKPDFELIYNGESGRHAVTWAEEGERIAEIREQIEGRRIVYKNKNSNGQLTVFMQLFLQVGVRQISALCHAPDEKFSKYQPLFLEVLSDVRVLEI